MVRRGDEEMVRLVVGIMVLAGIVRADISAVSSPSDVVVIDAVRLQAYISAKAADTNTNTAAVSSSFHIDTKLEFMDIGVKWLYDANSYYVAGDINSITSWMNTANAKYAVLAGGNIFRLRKPTASEITGKKLPVIARSHWAGMLYTDFRADIAPFQVDRIIVNLDDVSVVPRRTVSSSTTNMARATISVKGGVVQYVSVVNK